MPHKVLQQMKVVYLLFYFCCGFRLSHVIHSQSDVIMCLGYVLAQIHLVVTQPTSAEYKVSQAVHMLNTYKIGPIINV